MIFTYLSAAVDPTSTSRIGAQLVSGIGFLGGGIILKGEIENKITNLTTAASIWFSGAISMAIGFDYYFIAVVAVAFAPSYHVSRIFLKLKGISTDNCLVTGDLFQLGSEGNS